MPLKQGSCAPVTTSPFQSQDKPALEIARTLLGVIMSGVEKTDPVQFKGRFKQGPFWL